MKGLYELRLDDDADDDALNESCAVLVLALIFVVGCWTGAILIVLARLVLLHMGVIV